MNKKEFLDALRKSKSIKVQIPDIDPLVDRDFVKELRRKLGVSQTVFAKALGISVKTVEKWEQNKMNVGNGVKRLLYLLDSNPELFSNLYYREDSTFASKPPVYKDIAFSVKIEQSEPKREPSLRGIGRSFLNKNIVPTIGEVKYVS